MFYILSQCEVARVLQFRFLGLHLQHFSFSSSLDYLAIVTFTNNILDNVSNVETKYKVKIVVAIILKRTWEIMCDVIFNNMTVDITRTATLVE